MQKNAAKYPGTEAVLYLIVNVVCELAVKQMSVFAQFKKKYTQAYIDAILASLKLAEAMPNNKVRQGKQSDKRTTLKKLNLDICSLFQDLMMYLQDGFEASRWADMRLIAGGAYYEAATEKNWKASKTMQEMAMEFMDDYAGELENGDMPDDFAANFEVKNAAFLAALLLFATGKSTKKVEASGKMAANNALYLRIQSLMRDGRRIFADDATMMAQFSYEAQRKLLGSERPTGFRFKLQEADTLLPIEKASVRFLPSGKVFSEVEFGVMLVRLPELKEGSYSYVLQCPGYEEKKGELVAHTGVMHRVNLVLKPVVMQVSEGEDEKAG